jgi:ATP-dependent RNA helicase MSS116
VAVEDDVPMESNSTKFQELSENGFVDKHIINAITKGMNITTMTEVQAMTIPESLKGVDM